MVLPISNVPSTPAAASASPIPTRSIVPAPAESLIAVFPTAVLPPIMPDISTLPAPDVIVKVFPPSIVPTTPTVPPPVAVLMVVLPERFTAPVRVTLPAVSSLALTTAVLIVPSVLIVVPLIVTSLISSLVPISSIDTLPATAFKTTSVETLPSVPRIGTLIIILPPVELIVRSAASARSILPSSPPSAKVITPAAEVKVMSAPVRL